MSFTALKIKPFVFADIDIFLFAVINWTSGATTTVSEEGWSIKGFEETIEIGLTFSCEGDLKFSWVFLGKSICMPLFPNEVSENSLFSIKIKITHETYQIVKFIQN